MAYSVLLSFEIAGGADAPAGKGSVIREAPVPDVLIAYVEARTLVRR